MKGYNKAILMGNLTRDPEVRFTQNGNAVATFSIACNRSAKQPDGSYKEVPDFVNCVVWGKSAETIQKYFRKGSAIHIDGRIASRSYEKDGQKRNITEVVVESFTFCGSSQGNGGGNPANNGNSPQPTNAPSYRGYTNQNAPSQQYSGQPVQEFPMDISGLEGNEANIPF